jgi:hypothetical protein
MVVVAPLLSLHDFMRVTRVCLGVVSVKPVNEASAFPQVSSESLIGDAPRAGWASTVVHVGRKPHPPKPHKPPAALPHKLPAPHMEAAQWEELAVPSEARTRAEALVRAAAEQLNGGDGDEHFAEAARIFAEALALEPGLRSAEYGLEQARRALGMMTVGGGGGGGGGRTTEQGRDAQRRAEAMAAELNVAGSLQDYERAVSEFSEVLQLDLGCDLAQYGLEQARKGRDFYLQQQAEAQGGTKKGGGLGQLFRNRRKGRQARSKHESAAEPEPELQPEPEPEPEPEVKVGADDGAPAAGASHQPGGVHAGGGSSGPTLEEFQAARAALQRALVVPGGSDISDIERKGGARGSRTPPPPAAAEQPPSPLWDHRGRPLARPVVAGGGAREVEQQRRRRQEEEDEEEEQEQEQQEEERGELANPPELAGDATADEGGSAAAAAAAATGPLPPADLDSQTTDLFSRMGDILDSSSDEEATGLPP